jgi:beta-glucanase (GH16 family)
MRLTQTKISLMLVAAIIGSGAASCAIDEAEDEAEVVYGEGEPGLTGGTGLRGEYFDNRDFSASKLTRVDPTVNFNWGTGSPNPAISSDTFSVRWTGRVSPRYSETYRFYTTSDDGVRLWVNGQLLIDNWTDHGPTENSGTIALTAEALYDIRMEFYENGGGATATLSWSSPSVSKRIIPTTRLFPPTTGSPDLVVTQINLSPSSPIASDPVTFSAAVRNQGTAATPAGTTVGVLFSVDGSPVAWSDTFSQSVAAGATVNLTANGGPSGATWTATSGSHQVVAFVDDINRIPNESNENNNQLTRSFSVGTVCTPACSGKVCGPNGCGGSCGSCPSGQACNASGQCTSSSTLPPLWNASPPTGTSPAPSGPVVGRAGEFDTGTLATNEVWDNFNGASGSNPDSRLWVEDTVNQGGTQVYNPSHSFLDGSGNAVLEATQSGGTITSGRFTSRTKFNMQYGWCAARIKFPKAGRSWFPAWWMLMVGYNYNPYGEIDIMEFFGNTTQYSTHIHFGGSLPSIESDKAVPSSHSGGNAGDGFHTYWMQWEPDRIRIGVDDLLMGDWTPASVPAGAWDHMRQPFYFIANFAVAPPWLPAPLPTDFPARMLIDWAWYKPL